MKVSLGWRIIIATTLGVFGLIVLTTLELVLSSPGILALMLLAILVSCYAVWLVFTGTQKRLFFGWLLLVVSGVAIIGSLHYFRLVNDNHLFLRVIALAITYCLLVGFLRREYWRQKRKRAAAHIDSSTFQNAVLIINPKSGNGRAIKAGIPEKAKKLGITAIVTKKNDNIEQLAEQAVADGADVLGVSGGDGTLGAVAKVAIENNMPLVVLPGGTRCHFARDVGLDPKQIDDALECFRGVECRVDVGSLNGRIFLNNASFGLYADIVDSPEYRQYKVRTTRSVLRSLLDGTKAYYPLIFTDNNQKKHKHAVQVLVGVNAYETVNALELGRRHRMDAGVLQITAITKLTDNLIGKMMGTIVLNKSLEDTDTDCVFQWEAQQFWVSSPDKPLIVGVDGEREEYTSPVTIEILPKALRLMVPPEGMRRRPAHSFSPKSLTRLWQTLITKR